MRMDLFKSRYENFDELYDYCYRVAGTVALMSVPVMGVDKNYKVGGRVAGWPGGWGKSDGRVLVWVEPGCRLERRGDWGWAGLAGNIAPTPLL